MRHAVGIVACLIFCGTSILSIRLLAQRGAGPPSGANARQHSIGDIEREGGLKPGDK